MTLTDPGGFAPTLTWTSTTGGRVTAASVAATSTTTIAFGEVCGCDDDDPCTVDSCAAPGVCGTSAAPDLPSIACEDGLWCNGDDACQGGQCRPIAGTEPCVATQQCVASTCDEEGDRCVASDARDSVCLEGGWAFYVAVRSDDGASGVVKCTVQAGATTASCDSSTILDSACE